MFNVSHNQESISTLFQGPDYQLSNSLMLSETSETEKLKIQEEQ